jgi:hypothetical protein
MELGSTFHYEPNVTLQLESPVLQVKIVFCQFCWVGWSLVLTQEVLGFLVNAIGSLRGPPIDKRKFQTVPCMHVGMLATI